MFTKGKEKTGGRKKGKANKTTEEIRALIQSFIETNAGTLQANYNKLSDDKKLIFFEKMLGHVLPKPLDELQRLTDEQLDELIKRLKQHD
jgi:hypothetical protein